METKVILIRHAETENNSRNELDGQSDTVLSDRGIEQAKSLARHLRGEKIDIAYSSVFKRTIITCKTVLKFHNDIPIIEIPEFKEIDHNMWQ